MGSLRTCVTMPSKNCTFLSSSRSILVFEPREWIDKGAAKKALGRFNQRSEGVIPHAEEDERGLGEDLEERKNCGEGEGHVVRFLLLLFFKSEVFRVTHSENLSGDGVPN